MTIPKTQLLSLYRRLLRELPTKTASPIPRASPSKYRSTSHQKLSAPSVLQKRIRATLSEAASPTSSATSTPISSGLGKEHLPLGEQFVQYVQAQRMYATLIERYNPGMGMSEEERVRLTARKVGMDLPPEFSR